MIAPEQDAPRTNGVVALTADGARPAWAPAPGEKPTLEVIGAEADHDDLAARLRRVHAIVIDAGVDAPLSIARRLHRLAPGAQLLVVAADGAREDLQRSLLFTPGIGEIWIVGPEEVTPALLQQAADVGGKRSRHARQSGQVARRVAALDPPRERRPFLADRYLATLLELLPDPVLALADNDDLVFANPAARSVLQVGAEEVIGGKELRDRLDPVVPEDLDELLERGRRRLARAELELGPTQDRRVYHAAAAPVAGERPVRALVLHDVTEQVQAREQLQDQAMELETQSEELKQQNEELQAQTEQMEAQAAVLEEAMRHRTRFYTSMSHELRTPINAIIGYNELLRDEVYGPVHGEQRNAMDRIHRAARHLLELVNDALDLSKVEAGKVVVQPEPVDIQALLMDLTATLQPLADEHGVELRFDVARACRDEPFFTDPRRVRQILMNLLSNAIRYGAGEPVDVRCRMEDARFIAEIVDRGAGIVPDDLERIFDEFVQVTDEDGGGTGLGLPIARTLARYLGGDVSATSDEGRGSTFSLELPRFEDTPDAVEAPRPPLTPQ